jgi:hypothetical protein
MILCFILFVNPLKIYTHLQFKSVLNLPTRPCLILNFPFNCNFKFYPGFPGQAAKTFIPQAFQLTFIQTFRKYLGAFDKVKELPTNHQTIHTYKNVIHKDYFQL